MRIQLLGTGTPTPSLRRMGSSHLVRLGDDVILFDHGPGAYHRMMQAGVRAIDVTHVFFTHLHYDHCVDFPRLLLTRWDQRSGMIPELKVFGPPHTTRMAELLFSRDGAYGPDLRARTENEASLAVFRARGGASPRPWPAPEVRELESGDVVEGNGWRVTTTEVVHAQPALACSAYRLDGPDGSFVYSGDTSPCDALVGLARDCDVLLHMCHRITGSELHPASRRSSTGHMELAEVAKRANAKTVVLTHITEQMDVPGVRERVLIEMARVYPGNLIWGEDLLEVPLGAPEPARLE